MRWFSYDTGLNMLMSAGCRGKHEGGIGWPIHTIHIHRKPRVSPQECQDIANDIPQPDDAPPEPLSDRQIQTLIADALPDDLGLRSMTGFNMDLSANADFRKLFFSATCECGTSALLSVEVSKDKTADEIRDALPSVIDALDRQTKQFRSMSCDLHNKMRLGPLTGQQPSD